MEIERWRMKRLYPNFNVDDYSSIKSNELSHYSNFDFSTMYDAYIKYKGDERSIYIREIEILE